MLYFNKIGLKLKSRINKTTEAGKAYNLWSSNYDDQPDNLMLYLDELIFDKLLKKLSIGNKKVLDYGCGTGRHWPKLYAKNPKELIGVDISKGMLDVLSIKYPHATVIQINDNLLNSIGDNSIDIIISTLTIAHIKDINELFRTLDRILKPEGSLIITDFHPQLLDNGGKRVFTVSGKTFSIQNYVHSIESIERIAFGNNLTIISKEEKFIDEKVKSFYEKQNALPIYQKYYGYPVIYGLHLNKK